MESKAIRERRVKDATKNVSIDVCTSILTFANFLFWNFNTFISSSVELETAPIVCGR